MQRTRPRHTQPRGAAQDKEKMPGFPAGGRNSLFLVEPNRTPRPSGKLLSWKSFQVQEMHPPFHLASCFLSPPFSEQVIPAGKQDDALDYGGGCGWRRGQVKCCVDSECV